MLIKSTLYKTYAGLFVDQFKLDFEKRKFKKKMLKLTLVLLSISALVLAQNCRQSRTTASGWAAPKKICAGQLIFDENFDRLDKNKWKPEVTLGGGGVSIKIC